VVADGGIVDSFLTTVRALLANDVSELLWHSSGLGDPMDRQNAPLVGTEREVLTAWLDYHRSTLELKCAGLTPDQLRLQSVPPSTLSLLGLVRHLAEVERAWFRKNFEGEVAPPIWNSDDDRYADFRTEGADVDEAFRQWNAECGRSREIVAATASLDAEGIQRRTGASISLRWVLVHMIEEYARHNGHADLLRERIDGATGK